MTAVARSPFGLVRGYVFEVAVARQRAPSSSEQAASTFSQPERRLPCALQEMAERSAADKKKSSNVLSQPSAATYDGPPRAVALQRRAAAPRELQAAAAYDEPPTCKRQQQLGHTARAPSELRAAARWTVHPGVVTGSGLGLTPPSHASPGNGVPRGRHRVGTEHTR